MNQGDTTYCDECRCQPCQCDQAFEDNRLDHGGPAEPPDDREELGGEG